MKKIIITILFICYAISSFAQKPTFSPLFSEDTPLNIKLEVSLKEVRKETNDSTYMDGVMHYENTSGAWDSIDIQIRTRGDFRLKECFYPPLRVKIKKKNAKGTLFEGNKALKLVMPCNKGGSSNDLVIKEFLCYKIYEKITPYTFSTRLINLDFWDMTGKKPKNYQLTTFFIEDDDIVAERYGGMVRENLTLHPLALHDTTAIQHAIFQYLIANIDWSTTYMHNEKIIVIEDPLRYIPLTYDFDMSGFVNAPYAVINPQFEMTTVRDRIYRGFCRKDNQVTQYVRNQFIQEEESIYNCIAEYEDLMDKRDYTSLVKFVDDFFEVMKSDKLFESEIIDKCRTE
jgi:hypothetical protein